MVTVKKVPVRCPGFHECGSVVSNETFKIHTSEALVAKYERAQRAIANPTTYRECYHCFNELVFVDKSKEIRCSNCGAVSCFLHGHEQHPFETCQAFSKRANKQKEEDLQSQLVVDKISQRCPGCQAPTVKIAGCDHMVCLALLSFLFEFV
jgi:hypothetical protein